MGAGERPQFLELSDPNGFQTQVRAPKDGDYILQVRIKLGGGALGLQNESNDGVPGNNQQISKVLLVWDTTPPEFLSLNAINEAADLVISKDEYQSSKPAVELKVVGHDAVTYSTFLDAAVPVNCDGTKTYKAANPPTIASMPEINGPYVICARVSDTAGNVAYGKSSIIMRDVIFRPSAPKDFSAMPGGGVVSLSYASSSEETQGFLLIRSNDPISFVPTDGQAYMAGSVVDGALVMGAGSATSATDLDLSGIINYYAVFAYNEDYLYSPVAKTDTITGQPFSSGVVLLVNEAADGEISASDIGSVSPAVSASLASFSFKYSTFIPLAGATCDDSLTYSVNEPKISEIASINGDYLVCVVGEDASGHIVYGASTSITVSLLPQTPANLSVVANPHTNDLSWSYGGGGGSSYLVVRSTSAVTFVPVDGNSYAVGSIDANQKIVAVGNSLTFQDYCFEAATYYYAVFSFDGDKKYSTPAIGQVDIGSDLADDLKSGANINTCIAKPANLALISNTNGILEARNPSTKILKYEFDLSSSTNFSTKTTYSINNVASGVNGSVTIPSANLTHGSIYWLRMRFAEEGTNEWSEYSKIRSFRIDSTLNQVVGFHVDSFDQISSVPSGNISNLTWASTNSGEIYISSGQTLGYYKSPAISLQEFGWLKYGLSYATWYVPAPAASQYSFHIDYFDPATGVWAQIPTADFPGNTGNGQTLHGNLDAIDPAKYPIIRFEVRLYRNTTGTSSPKFYNFTLQPRTNPTGSQFANGGFESANAGEWVVMKTNNAADPTVNLAYTTSPRSGTKSAYINHNLTNYLTSREAMVYQTIDVPVTATSLKFWRRYSRATWGAYFRYFINETLMETPTGSNTTWTQVTYDITAYRGKTITFSFGMFDYYWAGAGDHGAWLQVDDVAIE